MGKVSDGLAGAGKTWLKGFLYTALAVGVVAGLGVGIGLLATGGLPALGAAFLWGTVSAIGATVLTGAAELFFGGAVGGLLAGAGAIFGIHKGNQRRENTAAMQAETAQAELTQAAAEGRALTAARQQQLEQSAGSQTRQAYTSSDDLPIQNESARADHVAQLLESQQNARRAPALSRG